MIRRSVSSLVLLGLFALLASASAACSSAGASSDAPTVQASAWDAESVDDETKSTHLWIVNRALDILAQHRTDSPEAARVVDEMGTDACRAKWQQGLLDADFKALYNNGRIDIRIGATDLEVGLSGATWKSHFYDVDTGLNYKGESSPTARTQAMTFADQAFSSGYDWNGADAPDARDASCYALGLALHYFTDITQPMHANNFTAVDRPQKLHSNLEAYAVTIQSRFQLADWTGAPTGTMDDHIDVTARRSKDEWTGAVAAVAGAYSRHHDTDPIRCGLVDANPARFLIAQTIDHPVCWQGDDAVDGVVGSSLQIAQDETAKYLYLAGKRMLP